MLELSLALWEGGVRFLIVLTLASDRWYAKDGLMYLVYCHGPTLNTDYLLLLMIYETLTWLIHSLYLSLSLIVKFYKKVPATLCS